MTSQLELSTLHERVAEMTRFADKRRPAAAARSRTPRLIRLRQRPVLSDVYVPQQEVATAAK